jgi:hypothetical protein
LSLDLGPIWMISSLSRCLPLLHDQLFFSSVTFTG